MKKRSIIVTGCAGFIGHAVSRCFLDRGLDLVGVDNVVSYYDVNLKLRRLDELRRYPTFNFQEMDISSSSALRTIFEKVAPKFVVHLAAQAGVRYSLDHPEGYTSSNVAGFLSILEACRHQPVEHLIYASSSSVYGGNTKVPFHESDPVEKPVSLYAATKRANELMAQTYSHLFRIPVGLRFFTVYGPWGRPDMAYFKFTDAIIRDRPIDVYNNGELWRDFTYIQEVVEAIWRLSERPPADNVAQPRVGRPDASVPHQVFNIGNHTPVKLERFIEILEELIGKKATKRFLPMQPGDVVRTFANVDALREAVDFAPDTPIEAGLSEFVKWYRTYYGC